MAEDDRPLSANLATSHFDGVGNGSGRIVRQPSLSDAALGRVSEAILRGELAPGKRIKEATLARELGISRGPLREALGRLEGRNLLVRSPQIGVMLVDPSPEEIIDTFLIREVLEGLAVRLAAERMTDQELKTARQMLEDHTSHPDVASGDAYYQSPGDEDFHYFIIRGSRCPRLDSILLGELYFFLRIFRYRSSAERGRAAMAHAEHVKIAAALSARDSNAAEMAMRTHIANARKSISHSLAMESQIVLKNEK